MRYLVAFLFSAASWGFALIDQVGWAFVTVFGLLLLAAAWAMSDLRARPECWSCGHPIHIGRLGLCSTCAPVLRPR